MARPGFILNVDKSTPPILFWHGEQLKAESLPFGSRVIYGPEPAKALANVPDAVRDAIANPVMGDGLAGMLRADTVLTIAFDDNAYPLFETQSTDSRQLVIESVLNLAADAGIDDVVLVAARGLRKRMTEHALRRALGERVYESFAPRGLLQQHDAENVELLSNIATSGEPVEINKRIADSDLVVYVGTSLTSRDTGWSRIVNGIAGRKTLGKQTPEEVARVASAISENVRLFQIDTTVDTTEFPPSIDFVRRREREWRLRDKASFKAFSELSAITPTRITRRSLRNAKAPRMITGVYAGDVEAVGKTVATRLQEDRSVDIDGQTDVLTLGVPSYFPFGTDTITNPILAIASALGYMFNLYEGKPLVRQGGVVIVHHPMKPDFHTVNHPSYIDFFQEALNDKANLDTYEAKYANDPWFTKLYSESYATHATHPFHMWRWASQAVEYLGGVIVVGGHTDTVRRLGFKPASTFQDAYEMAKDVTGAVAPTLTHLHAPPIFTTNVS